MIQVVSDSELEFYFRKTINSEWVGFIVINNNPRVTMSWHEVTYYSRKNSWVITSNKRYRSSFCCYEKTILYGKYFENLTLEQLVELTMFVYNNITKFEKYLPDKVGKFRKRCQN